MTTDNQSIRQRCLARYLLLNKRTASSLTIYLDRLKTQKPQLADQLQTFIDAEKSNFRGWCALHSLQSTWRNFCYYYASTYPVRESLE